MITDKTILSDGQKHMCERWLNNWSYLSARLTDKKFTEGDILMLLKYELDTRRRKTAVERLLARYYRLKKINELKKMIRHINGE